MNIEGEQDFYNRSVFRIRGSLNQKPASTEIKDAGKNG